MSSTLTTVTIPQTRHVMPLEGKVLREGLYLNGHTPTLAEKLATYQLMLFLVPNLFWYTRKKHLNWCLTQEH
ncbi:hypothetical protein C8T65DRAFT_735843 [Cerioporus squamosus]|nr:hypothetical protein C8T65DRAFT_735843 [Cerioporus squamosus]